MTKHTGKGSVSKSGSDKPHSPPNEEREAQTGKSDKPHSPPSEEREAQTGKSATGLGEEEPVGPWSEEEPASEDEANYAEDLGEEETGESTLAKPPGAAAPGSTGAEEDTRRAAEEAGQKHKGGPGKK
jgi:hypothetical protein